MGKIRKISDKPLERKVFALRGHEIAGRMTLRESTGHIEALDSTGTEIGRAHYVRGTGWVIVRTVYYRQIMSTVHDKLEAIRALRHLVGDLTS